MVNVLLISIDTLRADHLSCYGYPRLTSPHIDRFAAQGVRFAECFGTHIPTHPAHTTIFTGKDAMSHQIVAHGGKVELDPKIKTLAELLQEAGYFTLAADNLGRWFKRGFQVYEGYQWETSPHQPWRKGEAVNKTALRLLNAGAAAAKQGQPFFLFVHYWDPHTPYLPPPPYDRLFYGGDERDPANKSMEPVFANGLFADYFRSWMGHVTDIRFPIAQYDGEIAYVDTCFAQLMGRLDELGLTDSTLVVLVSDHGEEMDEHGMYFDHHGLYDTNAHVPLMMRLPGRLPASTVVRGFVRHMDIAPTILELAQLDKVREKIRFDGVSLVPLLSQGEQRVARGVCDELYLTECSWMRKRALRTRTWKLIEALEPDFHGLPPLELYNLVQDPGERHNVADAYPQVVQALLSRLHAWAARRCQETGLPDPMMEQRPSQLRLSAIGGATDRPQDRQRVIEQRLRNMGYVE